MKNLFLSFTLANLLTTTLILRTTPTASPNLTAMTVRSTSPLIWATILVHSRDTEAGEVKLVNHETEFFLTISHGIGNRRFGLVSSRLLC
jgi:hypothetical protein